MPNEGNVHHAKVVRSLDCSALCLGTDCFFCTKLEPVFKACSGMKYQKSPNLNRNYKDTVRMLLSGGDVSTVNVENTTENIVEIITMTPQQDVMQWARLIGSLSNLRVSRTDIRCQTSSNSGLIRPVTLELFALDC